MFLQSNWKIQRRTGRRAPQKRRSDEIKTRKETRGGSNAKDRRSNQSVLRRFLCRISLNAGGHRDPKTHQRGQRDDITRRNYLCIDRDKEIGARLETEGCKTVAELTDRLVLRVGAATTHGSLRHTKQWEQAGISVKGEDDQQKNQNCNKSATEAPQVSLS